MPRDARGISRVGMFEKLHDPTTGKTFSPVSGVNGRVTYEVSDNTTFTTSTHRRSGEALAQEQAFQAEYHW